MMRKGYSLPEVMFGLLIGAMISGILFESITQMNQIFARVTALSGIERQFALMQTQFENDFSGMFAPVIVEADDDENSAAEGNAGDKKEKKSDPTKDQSDKETPGFKSFVFEGTTQGLIPLMTFITTNPLLSYRQPAPRAVRVAYRVIPDPENEGHLLLVRQQSEELSLKKFEKATKKETKGADQKPIRSYEVARALTAVKFEFYVEKIEKEQPDKKQPAPAPGAPENKNKEDQEEEKPRVFILIDDWLKLSQEEREKFEAPEIPVFVHLTISAADERKKIHTFDYWFAPCCGIPPLICKGITSDLPSPQEMHQRALAQEHTNQLHAFNDTAQGEIR